MKLLKTGSLLSVFLLSLDSSIALAAMGNSPSSYGIFPHDIATAQAFSLFNAQSSAVYYNPAALVNDPRGELTFSYTHAKHTLEVDSLGGSDPLVRDGTVLDGEPSQLLMMGLKTNLSGLTTFENPLYFGISVGLERVIKEVLSFEADTSAEGQFLEYGRQPLFLTFGLGTTVWRGVSLGVGVQINLRADASLDLTTTVAGETSYETVSVSAEPVMRPTFGLSVDLGKTFCPDKACFADNFDVAVGYRNYSKAEARIQANAMITNLTAEPIVLGLRTIDSFQPATTSFGIQAKVGANTRVAFNAEHQAWSRLEDEFDGDTVRDQADAGFKDIIIPRIGVEYDFDYRWGQPRATLMAGVSFEESPLDASGTLNVNYLDNDKVVFGLGIRMNEPLLPWFAYPMQFEFAYQYHMLQDRTFDLYYDDVNLNPSAPASYETVESSGDVHVLTASWTLRF